VKAVWKKNPNEYTVFLENGEYKLVHDDKLFKEETYTTLHVQNVRRGGWDSGDNCEDWDDEWEDCEV
jgi:hypothetical protein